MYIVGKNKIDKELQQVKTIKQNLYSLPLDTKNRADSLPEEKKAGGKKGRGGGLTYHRLYKQNIYE